MKESAIYTQFKETLEEDELLKTDNALIILGLSGGVDSVCLLDLFLNYLEENPESFTLVCHHQNHQIRADAKQDVEFCKELCQKRQVKLFISTDDVPKYAKEHKLSLESAGRIVRHKNWQELSDKLNKNKDYTIKIATAHHANDQAETVLLNLARGAGLSGLAAIDAHTDVFIRPLIKITKDKLYDYARKNNLQWQEDYTNQEVVTRRNFIRLELLPLWQKYSDEGLVERIASSAEKISEVESFLSDYLASKVEDLKLDINSDFHSDIYDYYSVDAFLNLDKRLQSSALIYILNSQGLKKDIYTVHLENILELIRANTGEKSLNLPHDYHFIKNRKFFYFYKDQEKVEFPLFTETENPEIKLKDISEDLEFKDFTFSKLAGPKLSKTTDSKYIFIVNKDNPLSEDLVLRTYKPGDYLIKNDKKLLLKDYFAKILLRRDFRQKIPLICNKNRIFLIADKIIYNKENLIYTLENINSSSIDKYRHSLATFMWRKSNL